MFFLLLSILSSLSIALIFKLIKRIKVKLFPIIILNYITAFAAGAILQPEMLSISGIVAKPWFEAMLLIGVLLIVMFFVIGVSTQKAGIGVTTVASKMSVIIPILFSIIYYSEDTPPLKVIGIIIALAAVFLTVYKKPEKTLNMQRIYLPIILFIGAGLIDSLVKYIQHDLLLPDEARGFTGLSFGVAGAAGIIVAFFNKLKLKDYFAGRTLITGILLGLANYGSIFFLISALNHSRLDSSIVYGINNVGIIILSLLPALLLFKEEFSLLNKVGVLLAVSSVIILMSV